MFWKVLILLMSTKFSLSLAPNDLLIIILSQPDEYHSQLAYNLRLDILNQSLLISKDSLVNVHLTHEVFNHIGDWTILYMLPNLMATNLITSNIKWIIFCEDQSKVNLKNLLQDLKNVDHSKETYLGHPLHDQEATIIHHFAFFEYPKWFPYPLLRSGIAFSKPLINSLANLLKEKTTKLPRTEFFIDATHELSFFIWQNIKIENNKWKISSLTIEEKDKEQEKLDENQLKNFTTIIISEDSVAADVDVDDDDDDDQHNTSDKIEMYKVQSQSEPEYNSIINKNAGSGAVSDTIPAAAAVVVVDTKSKTQHQFNVDKNSKRKYSANKNENNFTENNNKQTDTTTTRTTLQKNRNSKENITIVVHHEDINDNTGTNSTNTNHNNKKHNNTTSSSSSSSSKNSYEIKQKISDTTTRELKNNIKKQLLLVNASSYFCTEKGSNCAIYPNRIRGDKNTLCTPINPKSIYFAIKTCQKFHVERIPMIEATWGQYAPIKRYFSDVRDIYIPTIATGIPNTDSGHCAKVLEIFKIAYNEIEIINKNADFKINWIVLSDDDTLLSISSVCDILGCFNPLHYIYLGERYGYRLHAKDGFNYITGGGGIAFSLPTIREIIKSCSCPQDSSPDDMIIGTCLRSVGIMPIHSSRFHQARPSDYPLEGLKIEKAVSFHKFWQVDPVYLYNTFLHGSSDQKLPNIYKYKLVKEKILNSIENNISKNCDNMDCNQISNKFNKAQQKLKNENLEHRRKLQAFSRSTTTLIPKSKFFQHIDL